MTPQVNVQSFRAPLLPSTQGVDNGSLGTVRERGPSPRPRPTPAPADPHSPCWSMLHPEWWQLRGCLSLSAAEARGSAIFLPSLVLVGHYLIPAAGGSLGSAGDVTCLLSSSARLSANFGTALWGHRKAVLATQEAALP